MASTMIVAPAMYADHHVVEVRRILHDVPGVQVVYASSAFGVVEIDFDAEVTSAEALERLLDEAGYLSDLPVPMESGEPATQETAEEEQYRRHTTANAPSGSAIAFMQELGAAARPLTEPIDTTEG